MTTFSTVCGCGNSIVFSPRPAKTAHISQFLDHLKLFLGIDDIAQPFVDVLVHQLTLRAHLTDRLILGAGTGQPRILPGCTVTGPSAPKCTQWAPAAAVTKFGQNQVWPRPTSAKPSLAKTKFGQNCCWPIFLCDLPKCPISPTLNPKP